MSLFRGALVPRPTPFVRYWLCSIHECACSFGQFERTGGHVILGSNVADTADMHIREEEAMRMSRLVMVVAAACFAASSLTEAQGRGNGPAGRGPQIARAGNGAPNVGVGRTGGGKSGNAGVTPGDSAKGGGNPGPTPGKAGDRGKNAGGGGRGNAGKERGNGGTPPGNAGEGHGNARGGGRSNADGDRGDAGKPPTENPGGRGNKGGGGRGNADDDQEARGGGRERGGSEREGASFIAKINPQLRARLESMLPSGMTLEQAADGFRNQGQFIAALQQSQNRDISFGDLKAQMTGDNPLSLGEAMRKLGVATDED
jgi:hypothetical protein